jgi:hypothetical protein
VRPATAKISRVYRLPEQNAAQGIAQTANTDQDWGGTHYASFTAKA